MISFFQLLPQSVSIFFSIIVNSFGDSRNKMGTVLSEESKTFPKAYPKSYDIRGKKMLVA